MPGPARRRFWVRVHRWLGVGLGVWFALVGITGSLLVYEGPIDAWLNPQLLRNTLPGPWLPPAAIHAGATQEFGYTRIERLTLPVSREDVYRAIVQVGPRLRIAPARVEATFNPVSGELLGTRDALARGLARPYLMKTLYDFHRNVLLGNTGSNLVGIAGFLLLASAVTGLYAAWPRQRSGWKRLVSVKLRSGATRVIFDIHRSLGSVMCTLLLLATLTGCTLVYLNYARDIVSVFSKVAPFPVVPWRENASATWPSFAELVAGVQGTHPELTISEIHIPTRMPGGYLFYLRGPQDVHRLGDTLVWVDPTTGDFLFERSIHSRTAGESFMHWLFPLHSGTAFGAPGMVAMCVTGLAPLILISTGLWVWLRKRRAAKIELRRQRRGLTARSVEQASSAQGSAAQRLKSPLRRLDSA